MRFSEFFVEEAYLKPATFADGTLRLSKHLQDRSTQRDIPMTNIMRVLQRLEAVRGKDLAALPPTSFIVKTPDNFELAIIKTQSLTTNKVEYIVATVRQRLRPGAGQRIIYLEDKFNEEAKTLDPEIYGEMLPTSTVKRIVNTVMSQVDPGAQVTVKQSPEGYYLVNSEKLRLDFGITADGGDINANIVNAYSSYKGKNVVTEIFGQCFRAAEQLWGKPNRFVMSAHEDRGHGVWQHIAQKLGAEWEGSINEIARIPQGDFGTAGTIVPPGPEVERKELPGGSGLTYGINRENDLIEIMIFDGDKMAGELDIVYTRGATKTWSVDTVAVDPAHRGRGIAKALYGIALSILKLPLEAGQLQTKHGQAMWLMLNSIPGVEVMGYDQVPTQRYQAQPGDQIVFQDKRNTGFTFPVRPGKHSMRSGRKGTGIYTSPSTTMIAKWTGQ